MKKEEKQDKKKSKVYFYPRTKLGKISFWLVIAGFVLIYLQYWTAMIFNGSIPPIIGLLPLILIIIFGITSSISIIKYKDKAISLFISSLIGLFGILMALGEFVFPH